MAFLCSALQSREHNVIVGQPLPALTLTCTAGVTKHDELKTRGRELWTVLPQAGGRLVPVMGQNYFSNASSLSIC